MIVTIDTGGTKTLVAAFADNGRMGAPIKFPTPKEPAEYVAELRNIVRERYAGKKVDVIVVALPGIIRDGVAVWCQNLGWANFNAQKALKNLLPGVPVLIENDANLAGLSEAKDAIDAIIEEILGTNAWNGTEMTSPEQEQDGFYKISTGAELAWFADRVNSGSTAIKGRLAGDVDLGKHAWTPIGNGAPFKGVFDGGGHTVKGLYVCGQTQYAGLFGIVGGDKDTSVSGLTVKGKIKNDNVRYAAGIAAVIEGGKYRATVRDCHRSS